MFGAVDGNSYLNTGVYFNTVVSMGMNGSHSARVGNGCRGGWSGHPLFVLQNGAARGACGCRAGPRVFGGCGQSVLVRTVPVYPAIAKAAHVEGTVVLAASISKAGTVVDLRVVSGPPMLQQAALGAVRTWRYRPYTLNGDPVEVETTVNVVFTIGR